MRHRCWSAEVDYVCILFGTDVIVQVVIGEPFKALMLLCRGIYMTQMLLCRSVVGKHLKALMLWCISALFNFLVLGWKTEPCPKYVADCICQCYY